MTSPLRAVPDLPPLPSSIVSGEGVPSVEEFGELVAEHSDTGRTAWEIRDGNVAEWAARRLIEARAHIEARRIEAESWHRQIDEWLVTATGDAQSIAAFTESCLKAYALRYRAETRRATLRLPSLDVRTKLNPGRITVEDAEAFIEWAKVSDPDALRVKYEPIADVVKGYRDVIITGEDNRGGLYEAVVVVDAAGEIVPGLGYKGETITATVP